MTRPAVAASCAALGISVVSNLLIVTYYDLAFAGFWDRLSFVTGMSALVALFVGLSVSLLGRMCVRWSTAQVRCLNRLQSVSLAAIVTVGIGIWADSFLGGGIRFVGLGAALLLAMAVIVVGWSVGDNRQQNRQRSSWPWWLVLGVTAFACWLFSSSVQPMRTTSGDNQPVSVAISGQQLPPDTNLLLVVVDTLRGDHLGFEGYVRDTSPAIDRLAAEGVAFRGTSAQATRTSPSMASLMTSTTPLTHGIIESQSVLGAALPSLGKILQDAGYQTAAIVANPMVGSVFGYDQGFSLFDEIYRESSDSIDATAVVDRAFSWLDNRVGEPFALWLHFVDPHTPYDPPEPWHREFVGDTLFESQPSEELPVGGRVGAMPPSAKVEGYASLRDYTALYDAEIRYTDSEISRLIDHLEQRALLANTLVVLTSDHGESLGDHDYFFSHGAYSYEPTSRVPLVFRHPSLEAPERPSRIPRIIDLVPSVVQLLGLKPSPRFEGVSLFSETVRAAEDSVAPILSGSVDYTNLAVRTEDAKLILVPRHWRGFDRVARWQLALWPTRAKTFPILGRSFRREVYDLAADPGENLNLAGQFPERESRLIGLLLSWVEYGSASASAPERRSREDLDREVERQLEALGYLD